MNSWGYGASLISHHWILRCVPLFSGDGKMPEKCEGALICQVELIKRLNVGKPENKL